MISIYEQIRRARVGEVLYTTRPARNVTSAASRLGRKVRTERCTICTFPDLSVITQAVRVKVVS